MSAADFAMKNDHGAKPLPRPMMTGTRRHRVAMVCDFFYPRLGGVENHIWSLSQRLVQLGHKVVVITHAYGNRRGVRYLPGPLKVYYSPILPMTDQDALPTFTATLPLIRWILIREGIDLVHAHQATSTMANEAVVYASAMGLATVYTDHSLFGFDDLAGVILNRVLTTTLSTLDAAIAVSHTCRDNLLLRAGLDPARVSVIANAVDPSKFLPDPSQRPKDRVRVVVVSRLVYRKGVDLLTAILPIVCRLNAHVDFVIGGDGNKRLALEEMVERERLQSRVQFLGAVPHAEVRDVLVQGHIFLNCSLTESFCIAILEAASCGLLVVSTNVGGVGEVLPDDMVVLGEPTVPSMVAQLQYAIDHVDQALEAEEAHQRVAGMYSWQRVTEETVEVYDRVMAQPRRSWGERLACYYRALGGGGAGLVAVLLAVTLQMWLGIVEWWQPTTRIDVVPDLVEESTKETNQDTQTRASECVSGPSHGGASHRMSLID